MPTHRRLTIRPEGELVRWSTDGSIFAVQTQNTIDIYSTVSTTMSPTPETRSSDPLNV